MRKGEGAEKVIENKRKGGGAEKLIESKSMRVVERQRTER